MSLFSRGSRRATHADSTNEQSRTHEDPASGPAAALPAETGTAAPRDHESGSTSGRGPWDLGEIDGLGDRVDLGALWVPKRYRLSLEAAEGGSVIAASVEDQGLIMRLQAFAAPKSTGLWDEIREELAAQARTGDGEVSDIPGPFGRELLVSLPGQAGLRNNVRFWGVDGPRWFVRAVLTGPHVLDEHTADRFADVFADVVVVRGPEARAPRELLELRPPEQAPAPTEDATSFDPMHRGPEITEVR